MEYRIKPGARGCTEAVKGKKGVYRIYFSLGKDPGTGRYLRTPKRTYHCKSKNPKNWRTELDKALDAYREELEGTDPVPDAPIMVSDYSDRFHLMREGSMGSPLAYEREGLDVRHIRELFGDARIRGLRPDDIRLAYANARRSGRFSESEIRRIHTKLKQVMQDALENDVITRNPCVGVKLPKVSADARRSLTADEASRFLSCLRKEALSPSSICTMVLLQCGLRKGEALGLSWGDYDPREGTLRIARQYTNDHVLRPPKSKMSRRVIAANGLLREYLDAWKKEQREQLRGLGIDQGPETPIVHSIGVEAVGGAQRAVVRNMDGHNYSRWFRNFCVDNGFGRWRNVTSEFSRDGVERRRGTGYEGVCPHMLRHTQATLLIGEGADVKTVQARLGHASADTTLNIYSHAIEANDRKAASVFGDLLSGE